MKYIAEKFFNDDSDVFEYGYYKTQFAIIRKDGKKVKNFFLIDDIDQLKKRGGFTTVIVMPPKKFKKRLLNDPIQTTGSFRSTEKGLYGIGTLEFTKASRSFPQNTKLRYYIKVGLRTFAGMGNKGIIKRVK